MVSQRFNEEYSPLIISSEISHQLLSVFVGEDVFTEHQMFNPFSVNLQIWAFTELRSVIHLEAIKDEQRNWSLFCIYNRN